MRNLLLLLLIGSIQFLPAQISTRLSEPIQVTGVVLSQKDKKPLEGVAVRVQSQSLGCFTDAKGRFQLSVRDSSAILVFSYVGFTTQTFQLKDSYQLKVMLEEDQMSLDEVIVTRSKLKDRIASRRYRSGAPDGVRKDNYSLLDSWEEPESGEGYNPIEENTDIKTSDETTSTISIDVDKASYANVRRFLNREQLPPADAVRVEEMINYFPYGYQAPSPKEEHPFAVHTEVTECPWNPERLLLHVAIQGQQEPLVKNQGSNLVFLFDVSGSMNNPNKLDLLKNSFALLVDQLNAKDKVSIVVYAGAAGMVLAPTSGDQKEKIKQAIHNLRAGGSTAGGAGIQLAYDLAEKNFIKQGNNRVILATDGDFNVGVSSQEGLVSLIEKKRDSGIFLTVLGFGSGNYQDGMMEQLADHGNGNYFYIDGEREAKKVLQDELSGTLFTIAKDVKIQVEFAPSKVQAYRLVGYENRLLENEDFANDKKDAGELGAGHNVTALYEIVPQSDASVGDNQADPLTLAYIRLRYKKPDGKKSILMETAINAHIRPLETCSEAFQ
ncbi:MAG: von Willebrand factor type A domain-containing protein, partial [Bacteroidota bacterium]